MNCAEYKELLVAYIEGFLEEPQKQALTEHLKVCLLCQKELQEIQRLQHRLLQNGQMLSRTDLEQEVMNRVIRQQSLQLKKAAEENIFLKLRRFLMKSPITKIAVAAAVVLVCLAGLHLWTGTKSGVALADVLAKVEQVQAFMYKMKMVMTGAMPGIPSMNREMDCTITTSNTYGTRWDITMTDPNGHGDKITEQFYVLPNRKVQIQIMPKQKKYMQMEFDGNCSTKQSSDDMLAKMKKQNNDPREMIKQIMNCKYTDLGRSEIDGIEVEGFRMTDPAFGGGAMEDANIVLWVDAEKWLPVRMEMDFKMGKQIQISSVIYDYQWDVSVDANEFEPIIPEGFTSIKAPSSTEDGAIEGLKSFADILGHYPKKLNIMDLAQELAAFIQEFAATDINTGEALQLSEKIKAAFKLKDEEALKELDKLPEEEKIKKIMEMLPEEEKVKINKIMEKKKIMEKIGDMTRQIQSLGRFYMTLVQEKKEPAYYGESVTPADTDKVLLRWKVSDSEYRVIFGDLHAETITTEKLAELEATLPK